MECSSRALNFVIHPICELKRAANGSAALPYIRLTHHITDESLQTFIKDIASRLNCPLKTVERLMFLVYHTEDVEAVTDEEVREVAMAAASGSSSSSKPADSCRPMSKRHAEPMLFSLRRRKSTTLSPATSCSGSS